MIIYGINSTRKANWSKRDNNLGILRVSNCKYLGVRGQVEHILNKG